jgi:hypothetical protein
MNYAELQQAIQDMTENYEAVFVNNIPMFVQQAEQRIYNVVQLPVSSKPSKGATKANRPYITLPTDFLSVDQLAIIAANGSYSFPIVVDVSFIRERYSNPTSTGVPKYYAVFNNNTLIVGPTPDQIYQIELVYIGYPESIVTAGTSFLGNQFSSVLLYGSLIEAYTFMKGEADIMAVYDTKYKEALALLKRLGDGLDRVDNYRNDQAVVPVQ